MAAERRNFRTRDADAGQSRVRRKPAKEKPAIPASPKVPAFMPGGAAVDAREPARPPFISGVESIPIVNKRPEGPRAKQFGVPETHIIPLEPCFFPEGAEWLRTPVGLVLGVAIKQPAPSPENPTVISPVVISYSPAPIPQMRTLSFSVVAELAAEAPGVAAVCRLIVLNREVSPLAIGDITKPIPLTGFPRIRFPIVPEQIGAETLLTVALEIMPTTPGARAVVRSVWAEIEG